MISSDRRRNRLALWYENTRYPGFVLAAFVCLLYAPSLGDGFVLDDHRGLRFMRGFKAGERESLRLYGFLPGGEANRIEREAGWYPWWVKEELRYHHLRLVSEWCLYGEYCVFGESPLGYRIVSLLLYALGVFLVLSLFRLMCGDERLARWAALLFAVAGCHSLPVVFISAQCDVIALVLAGSVLVLAGQFVVNKRLWALLPAAVLFAGALNAKEASLPVAVLPMCFWLAWREKPGIRRRAIVGSTLLTTIGLIWLACYASGGYGSNATSMLDPLHAPLAYLTAMPGRAVLLLSAWVIPLNPVIFFFHRGLETGAYIYGAIGVLALALIVRMYWKHHRQQRGLFAMALFVLAFLPILVCTPPDDRVLVLPSIGLTFLGAVWMAGRRDDAETGDTECEMPQRLRKLPLFLFVVAQISTVFLTCGIFQFMEVEAQRHMRLMAAEFRRPMGADDKIVFVNSARDYEVLFAQDRLHAILGTEEPGVVLLCDVDQPSITIVDDFTLRLEATNVPFLSSYVGQIGSTSQGSRQVGEEYESGEVRIRIEEMRDGDVYAISVKFKKPLTSDHYRFIWNDPNSSPKPYHLKK